MTRHRVYRAESLPREASLLRNSGLLLRALASVAGTLGAWLALGAVAVAPGISVTSRVGFLPPWWVLGLLAVVFSSLIFGAGLSRVRVVPLFGALACGLPWIPGAVPAALVAWQGVWAVIVWAGVAVAVVAAEPVRHFVGLRKRLNDPARAPWLAAIAAALLFLALWRGPARWLPAGDEPHYLVITQSLLSDGDLKIENNHQRGDYARYHTSPLKPDFLRRGVDREIYSVHAPGLPAVISPAFGIAGYPGAVLFIVIGCALGTALAWRLGWELTGHTTAAWVGWAGLVSAAPIAAHAYTVYPDGLSGVLVLVGVFAFVRARGTSTWPLVAGGVALAMLPWMHTRNSVAAAALGVAIVARIVVAPRRLAVFVTAPMVSATAWLASFKIIYGTFDPSAPYGGYADSSLQNLARGVPGLLFDQQFGAFTTAPVLIAGLVGTLVLLRGRRDRPVAVASSHGSVSEGSASADACPWPALGAAVLITFVSSLLVAAAYHMWWGGLSAPARFLVPVLWLAPIGLATAWATLRHPAARAGWLALLVLSAVHTGVMSFGGTGLLMFAGRAPYGRAQEWMTRAVDFSSAFPNLHRDTPGVALALTMVWLLTALVWWLAMRFVGATRARASAFAVPGAVVTVSLALEIAWALSGAPPLRVDASRQAALAAVWTDGVGVVLGATELNGRPVSVGVHAVDGVLPLLELTTSARTALSGGQLASLGSLPAGWYRIKLPSAERQDGRVRVEVGRGGLLRDVALRDLPVGQDGRAYIDVSFPLTIDALSVWGADGAPATGCTVSPLRLASHATQLLHDPALVGRRYGDVDVFFTSDAQYPERTGIWVKAGGAVPLVVQSSASGAPVTLRLRNGPKPNAVQLWSGPWRQALELAPNQEADFEWPWGVSRRTEGDQSVAGAYEQSPARVLNVQASTAFRPIDYEPASQDPRRLGVWVEFR